MARQTDHIFISTIREAGLYNEISQAYAGIHTNKVVGVMGGNRAEGYIVILRAVVTTPHDGRGLQVRRGAPERRGKDQ